MKRNHQIVIMLAGFTCGSLITLFVDPQLKLLIPILGLVGFVIVLVLKKKKDNPTTIDTQSNSLASQGTAQNPQSNENSNLNLNPSKADSSTEGRFSEVLHYLDAIETMITEEGNNDNLDNEIVNKSRELTAKIRHAVSEIEPLNDGDMDYTITRLVTKDLNSFVNPFLRLSGDMKIQNRRILLDGLKDINSKLDSIFSLIQQQDIIALRTKGDVIRSRYSTRSF